MLLLISKRLGIMLLTMLVVSVILFLALELNIDSVATKVLGPYSSDEQRQLWLEANGYNRPVFERYFSWAGNFMIGNFGESVRFRVPVSDILWDRLGNTLLLAGATFAIMIPLSILLGVLSGMKEGSLMDRIISLICIITTSIPEFASAVFLSAIFVFSLKWLPGTSSMLGGFDPVQLIMPVMVLVGYGFGYVARMTRASMAEVMATHYIRTAVLKGLPYRKVIFKHALRNALIAPFTIIMLQINWLLSGVIVVEYAFAYKGFGALLLEASLNSDVYLIEACTMVAVCAAVLTQLIADIGYSYLNPRIRFS
ncbi:MAG: peptide/nickel transport system permease protein [Motiliproteus sp.]|jgi:peptide/nickel transport system permease protein